MRAPTSSTSGTRKRSSIARPRERRTRENAAFPSFYKDGVHSGSQRAKLACTGPIRYAGQKQLAEDIANFNAALKTGHPVGTFIPSVSPSSCAGMMENKFYGSDEEHLLAVAEAGATAVIQPGGSIGDQKVIDAADEAGLAMVFTGMRHFRH